MCIYSKYTKKATFSIVDLINEEKKSVSFGYSGSAMKQCEIIYAPVERIP